MQKLEQILWQVTPAIFLFSDYFNVLVINIKDLIQYIKSCSDFKPYRGNILKVKIEKDVVTGDIVIKLYNSYYFKEYLKKAGFIYSDERCWIGFIHNFLNIEREILKRMILSMNTDSKNILMEVAKVYEKIYEEIDKMI